MRQFIQLSSVAAALLLAACGRESAMDDQMKQDLAAASAATMEMAPRGGATKVVSAIEQKQPAHPKVAPVRRASAPARTPPPEQPQETKTAPAAKTTDPAATRPVSAPPRVQPCPAGGCRSVDDVIRNAPFPIKPAFWRP